MNIKPAKLVLSQETLRRLTTGALRKTLNDAQALDWTPNCTAESCTGGCCSQDFACTTGYAGMEPGMKAVRREML
jgi:hypothetical protein